LWYAVNKVISKGALLQLPAPGAEEKHLLWHLRSETLIRSHTVSCTLFSEYTS